MAPIATPVVPAEQATRTPWKPNVHGLTSGQHEPVFSLLEPYDNFPKQITGPTVWTREELIENPSYWKHQWTDELIAEVEEAYDAFEATGKPITEITKVRALSELALTLRTHGTLAPRSSRSCAASARR